MRFGSLFSGIGGFDLGFERAGMTCSWQVEIDEQAAAVLAHHWPDAERFTDVKEVGKHNLGAVDVVCGGFPCQDLSVAGKRAGLDGERSGLWFEFHRIIAELKPEWVVIENVPGLLSSNGGRDFAIVIRGLVECGYGVAWRVLDSQFFGVPQRRRRVFIVGHFGSGRAAEVLFERESLPWDTPPSRETGEGVAGTIEARFGRSGGMSNDHVDSGKIVPIGFTPRRTNIGAVEGLSPTVNTGSGGFGAPGVAFNIQQNDGGNHKRKDRPNGGMYVKETDTALTVGTTDQTVIAFEARFARNGRGAPSDVVPPLKAQSGKTGKGDAAPLVCWHGAQITSKENRGGVFENVTPTLNGDPRAMVGVRRLTPTECARLQGFPDNWNDWLSDSARYRQFGNAVTVNVAEWIGRRIMEIGL